MRHNYHGDLGHGLLPCPLGDVRSSGEGASNDVVTAASGDFGNHAVGPPRRGTGGRQERRTTLWRSVTPKANRGKALRWATAARPIDPDGRAHLSNRQQPVSARQGKTIGSGLLLSRRWQGGRPRQGRIGAALLPLAMRSAPPQLAPSRGGKQQRCARRHATKTPAGQRPRHRQAKGQQTITAAGARGRRGAETFSDSRHSVRPCREKPNRTSPCTLESAGSVRQRPPTGIEGSQRARLRPRSSTRVVKYRDKS